MGHQNREGIWGCPLCFDAPSRNRSLQAAGKLKLETLDGEIWNVPIESSNGIIRIGWDNNAIYRLINLLSNEIVNVHIDYIDALGRIHSYFTPFVAMNQIGLVELDFMYNIGAISKVSRTN